MARPLKEGLDYFPIDVDMAADEKVEFIEAKYGPAGFATIIHLLSAIYRQGYYIKWGEMQLYVMSKRINLPVNVLSEMVNQLVNIGFFDINLYEKYEILTSHGIQTRYLQACEYRKKISMVKDYCLINAEDGLKEGRIVYKKLTSDIKQEANTTGEGIKQEVNTASEGIKQAESTQSKVKSNNNNNACARGKIDQQYQDSIHPFASVDESDTLHALMDQYGEQWVSHAITHAVACKRGEAKFLNIRYISRILQNWMEMGRDSPWDTSPRGSGDPSAPVIPLGEYEERRRKEDKAVKERDAQIEAMMMQELAAARHEKI